MIGSDGVSKATQHGAKRGGQMRPSERTVWMESWFVNAYAKNRKVRLHVGDPDGEHGDYIVEMTQAQAWQLVGELRRAGAEPLQRPLIASAGANDARGTIALDFNDGPGLRLGGAKGHWPVGVSLSYGKNPGRDAGGTVFMYSLGVDCEGAGIGPGEVHPYIESLDPVPVHEFREEVSFEDWFKNVKRVDIVLGDNYSSLAGKDMVRACEE